MTRAYRLGLTGSVGMGKTTTAAIFAAAGIPVWDADAEVHRLYAAGGDAVPVVGALCPDAVRDGQVDRAVLRAAILADADLLPRIEKAVHPLVAESRVTFLKNADETGQPIVVLDVPLLFETGAEKDMDGTVVVSVPEDIQRARVLARPGVDAAALARILSRQMPDAEKRRRATWVVTTETLDGARLQAQAIIRSILAGRAEHA